LDDREHGRWLSGEPGVFSNGALGTETSVGGAFLDYRIEEPIGQGGMGVVYVANDTRLKRKVALKLMAPELAFDERFRERFVRESELAMSLEHPNVVPIYDAGEADGRLYLAMRRVDGSDLRVVLRKEGALAPPRALSIVRQVAHALDAAHAKGLVHRDVKPSNVLLDESEHVYLADFGLTRRQSDDGAQPGDGRSLGTPAYLAPEQIEGGPIDARADVYSLGCLLYECLTGQPPFPAASRLEVAWAHLEEEPPRASERSPGLPRAIDDVIRKAMAKNPDERYATCDELVRAAEAALGIGRTSSPRRRRLLVGAVAAFVALAAVAFAFAFTGRGENPAAPSSVVVREDTLVRVDPAKNAIATVIDVGKAPNETAVGGDSVWVYNFGDHNVAEVDPRTNEVRHETEISSVPGGSGRGWGPLLAADDEGAWVVGYDLKRGGSVLTRVRSGGRDKREYRFATQLVAVAAANGTVWALASEGGAASVLRIDARSGRVTKRLGMRAPDADNQHASARNLEGQGLTVGGGFVWVTDAEHGSLYRIHPDTGDIRRARFGDFVTRPVFGFERVWLCSYDGVNGSMVRIDPRTLRNELARDALRAEQGHFAVGYGSVWRLDNPSGTLMRFRPRTGDPAGLVPIRSKAAPGSPFLVVTSISAGAGGVWLSIAKG
jgi:tRNA A-37 threonylcarbamoyl transferase component Bud32